MKPLGLYIHIPYCSKKCNYCDFFSIAPENEEEIKLYVQTLINNMRLWSDKLSGYTVDTVYIGGGTPSLLKLPDIEFILNSTASLFRMAENTEVTMEANPNSLVNLDLNYLKRCGLNRISMGLQSVDDIELKLLGRLHTARDASEAIEHILKAGINNYSLDVMLGIPLQNSESLSKSLDFCIDSGANHISTYMLKIEENTPFYKNKNHLVFADSDTVADLYELTCEKLTAKGFRHYEISNFCKNDLVSKHNMKYWLLDDYLGLGPSAHSMINNERFYYPRDFESFSNNVNIFESKGNTPEEFIMLTLRTDLGLNLLELKNKYSIDINNTFVNKTKLLESLGYINKKDDYIILTDKGFLVSNAIISEIIDTLI